MSRVVMHLTEREGHDVRYGLDNGHFRRRADEIAHGAGYTLTSAKPWFESTRQGLPGVYVCYEAKPMQQSVSRPASPVTPYAHPE